jgi:hypothetical protein
MDEEEFLTKLKSVHGMRVDTPSGPGRVWEVYFETNTIGVNVNGYNHGPIFFDLEEIVSLNVYGRVSDDFDAIGM